MSSGYTNTMEWSTILQALRDVLTVVGASKLIYEGYRQIKKTFRLQSTGKKLQSTVNRPAIFRNRLYKKVYEFRQSVQIVRHSLQKKSNVNAIPVFITAIPFSKKDSIAKILSANDKILFLKELKPMIFHKNLMKYLHVCF